MVSPSKFPAHKFATGRTWFFSWRFRRDAKINRIESNWIEWINLGLSEPRISVTGAELPTPRYVSAVAHRDLGYHDHAVTVYLPAWGQLIDHDMTQGGESKGKKKKKKTFFFASWAAHCIEINYATRDRGSRSSSFPFFSSSSAPPVVVNKDESALILMARRHGPHVPLFFFFFPRSGHGCRAQVLRQVSRPAASRLLAHRDPRPGSFLFALPAEVHGICPIRHRPQRAMQIRWVDDVAFTSFKSLFRSFFSSRHRLDCFL